MNIERRNELRQRVIEEKQLHQKRRAAEEEDVRAAHGAEYGVFGDLAEGKKYGTEVTESASVAPVAWSSAGIQPMIC